MTKDQITWRIVNPYSGGVVSLVGDESSLQKVKRDTGATQSLMLDSVLPLTETLRFRSPLHEVNIKSSFINGNIKL